MPTPIQNTARIAGNVLIGFIGFLMLYGVGVVVLSYIPVAKKGPAPAPGTGAHGPRRHNRWTTRGGGPLVLRLGSASVTGGAGGENNGQEEHR